MRIIQQHYRALRIEKGGGVRVLHIKKGELRIEKRGITCRAQCWHCHHAMALADGNLLSSFVAEKTKLECHKLQQRVTWGWGAEKNTIHLCSVSSSGGQHFYLCSRDDTAGGNLNNSLA